MIEGLNATWVSNTESLKEIELRQPTSESAGADTGTDPDELLVLSVILVVGPPDPNALSYLVPRSVFERELPVHVGALVAPTDDADSAENELLNAMLDILEVMNPKDIVVFLCDTESTREQAITLMAP